MSSQSRRGLALLASAACSAIAMPAAAQDGEAHAEVMQPIIITNTSELQFGNIIPGTGRSIIRVRRNNDGIRVVRGDAILAGGTVSRAGFTISGEPDQRVIIRAQRGRIFLTRNGGTERIRMNRLRIDGRRRQRLDGAGAATVNVSGQIRVNADQAAGVYTGTFNLTVDYP